MKKHVKAGLMALCLSMRLAASVIAGPLEDGTNAYKREDYPTALRLLRPLAEEGSPAAMNKLGDIYRDGESYVEARKWYRKAAEKGDPVAMVSLAVFFEGGSAGRRALPRR